MKMCDCNQGRLPCTCKMVEMVSVPRELAETFDRSESPPPAWAVEKLRAILDAPAELNQGEPVKIPARDESLGTAERDEYANGYRHGWNAYNDELAKLGPLYIRPAQGDPAAFVSPATLEAIKASGTRVHWVSSERNMEDCVPLYTHPAPAQQGEPVAWQVTWPYGPRELFQDEVGAKATMAPYQPLYTHPDSGEVERLREEVDHLQGIRQSLDQTLSACITKREDLRAQLSERDALLRGYQSLLRQVLPCLAMSTNSQAASYMRQIEAALSASAEPSPSGRDDSRMVRHLKMMLEKVAQGWPLVISTAGNPLYVTKCGRLLSCETALGTVTTYDPLAVNDVSGGVKCPRMAPGGCDGGHPFTVSTEPIAPKCETCDNHGAVGNILNAEPCPDCSYSAVEHLLIDENAEFEKTWLSLNFEGSEAGQVCLARGPNGEYVYRDASECFKFWMARAALERKS